VGRRILRSPFDGVVVQVFKREGEWVSPGDPVVQIVRIDRLRISGNLSATDWSPSELEGRKVTIKVKLPRGRVLDIPGKVVYVSPVVFEDQLPIEAEIDTPMQNGQPLVQAGLPASMTIHVSQPATAEHRPVSTPTRKTSGKGS
jgi:multidrug efflux pump subunit AcrA (membrane-fusion protein)